MGTGSLVHDVNRFWHRMKGKEDPYLKIGEENDRTIKGSTDYIWALKDNNFEIKQGEVVGIIGRNGAGKSTLLKILSRTTTPTTGSVKMKGRIASLLEVGTGFHPELSGRENIFLNGAILGMTKKEIRSKFDEIVDFSGVERYIDTPVKRYSSGMYVRLAFAVAAHLESEILIVDEVLAVGDAEFQKKCLGKMGEVSRGQGRTVLFVSHNTNSMLNLCSSCYLFEHGKIKDYGPSTTVINSYLNNQLIRKSRVWIGSEFSEDRSIELKKIVVNKANTDLDDVLTLADDLQLELQVSCYRPMNGVAFEMFLSNNEGVMVLSSFTEQMKISEGNYKINCLIPSKLLNNVTYVISVGVSINYTEFLIKVDDAVNMDITEGFKGEGFQGSQPGTVRPELNWQVTKN